jgi:hypothetical protein
MTKPITVTRTEVQTLSKLSDEQIDFLSYNIENLNANLERRQLTPAQVLVAVDHLHAIVHRCLDSKEE